MIFNLNEDRYLENPAKDPVVEGLSSLEVDQYAILDRGNEHYIQVYQGEENSYQLEYRAGSHTQHFAASGEVTLATVQQAFVAFLGGDEGWEQPWNWEPVIFDESFVGDLADGDSCDTYLVNDQEYKKVRVGDEQVSVINAAQKCAECGLSVGNYHSPDCQSEECPACHKRFSACDCE
ncbi:hypothetical protein FF011L_20330 [Roseimaritima multifibrata]|uniref:Uncharacterized protein n=1 Tax=Roseimaritima multifibrata TaxID=1930274 RepID=A0A517MEG2_9BACT|nr:hypothetical protein [Roseimaritima multifibrata]QDS93271.1 hypothetical protein FF011L_20330 [Roseimaritima multifibrata]